MAEPGKTPLTASVSRLGILARKPAALAVAGVLGAAVLGASIIPETASVAVAQSNTSASQTVQTPYGRAPLTFADLVEKVRPAVVSVQVKSRGRPGPDGPAFGFKDMPGIPDDLRDFFERFQQGRPGGQPPRRPQLAQGSGFIISPDGYVVTNHHVIANASEIVLTLDNGEEHEATIIGSDERTDLALLKIKTKGKTFPTVSFAKKKARVGDWVLAVGNPFGLGGTVTAGIVSAHNRDIGSGPYGYLQIDAAVNRGNSGGPAFNLDGEVVGVNTAIFSPSGGNVGIAFAVPADLTQKVVAQLKNGGTVARGWLGVTIQNVNPDIAESLGIEPKGAMVTKLSENGPAARSRIEVGDVIVRVGDEDIKDSRDLARKIADIAPNTKVKITVLREGDRKVIPVTLGKFPSGRKLAALRSGKVEPETEQLDSLGMTLAPASERGGAGEEGVVIVDIDPESAAAGKGLKAGDVILKVAGISVHNPRDVEKGLEKARKRGRGAVDMLVRSGERQRFIAIPLKKT
ncbi:MAG: Do family serine endopeptidase [Alphaproteobacteria bacterium]|nr:MAG: Do family serine endopeptidase [Alphaproteobacteria bacterium]